jgi:hypothetical protein
VIPGKSGTLFFRLAKGTTPAEQPHNVSVAFHALGILEVHLPQCSKFIAKKLVIAIDKKRVADTAAMDKSERAPLAHSFTNCEEELRELQIIEDEEGSIDNDSFCRANFSLRRKVPQLENATI